MSASTLITEAGLNFRLHECAAWLEVQSMVDGVSPIDMVCGDTVYACNGMVIDRVTAAESMRGEPVAMQWEAARGGDTQGIPDRARFNFWTATEGRGCTEYSWFPASLIAEIL